MFKNLKLFFQRHLLDVNRRFNDKVKCGYNPYPEVPSKVNLSSFLSHYDNGLACPRELSYSRDKYFDAKEWQGKARVKLAELMNYDNSIIKVNEKYKEELDAVKNINRARYYLEGFDGNDIPLNLFWKNSSEIHSVLIALAGSASGAHLLWGDTYFPADVARVALNSDIAIQAANRGFLVVCLEQRCFGEREERHLNPRSNARCVDAFMHSLLLGRTLIGENVTDVSMVISWLENSNIPFNISNKPVWIYGHSTGGTHAVYAAAIDRRIKGVVASGCVSPIIETLLSRRNPEGDAILPGILKWFDYHDLLCLCAPRPFIAVGGKTDHIFPYEGMNKVVNMAKPIYNEFNVSEHLQIVTGEGGHRMYTYEMWPTLMKFFSQKSA